MSKTVYAGVETLRDGEAVFGPVIPFPQHDPMRLKEGITVADTFRMDLEEYEAAHEPNPDYVEHASLDMANANARTVFANLGFDLEDGGDQFPIEDVYQALFKRLNAPRPLVGRLATVSGGFDQVRVIDCALTEGDVRVRMEKVFHIVKEGRLRGATHIVVV